MKEDAGKDYFIQIDKTINRIWHYFYNAPKYFWEKNKEERKLIIENYKHLPVNYALLLIILISYILGKLFLRSIFTTHYKIRKQLKRLNESITYNVELEINAGIGNNNNLNLGAKKKRARFIVDEREIEKELQDVLINVQKIPMFMARPEFVIVFDELDKISPELLNKEETAQESKIKEIMFTQNSTRERQAIILKLLSNMKYFLSTANAKFIFIAGREMYDMYLADIADRNNYFGSIFNDVIFVPSFLSDNDRKYDITALTEEFVCHNLIPENYPTYDCRLKIYRQYLETYFEIDNKLKKKEDLKNKMYNLQTKFLMKILKTLSICKYIKIKKLKFIKNGKKNIGKN